MCLSVLDACVCAEPICSFASLPARLLVSYSTDKFRPLRCVLIKFHTSDYPLLDMMVYMRMLVCFILVCLFNSTRCGSYLCVCVCVCVCVGLLPVVLSPVITWYCVFYYRAYYLCADCSCKGENRIRTEGSTRDDQERPEQKKQCRNMTYVS